MHINQYNDNMYAILEVGPYRKDRNVKLRIATSFATQYMFLAFITYYYKTPGYIWS